ncbi:hypothetical protein RIF29_02538 [Crotalaria pallida]|uniref:Uncharacterized protein n=1 Tax=Crotalaria pallida TaxID=3830 RepID=A0AAN9P8P1_CROPI
MPPGASMVHCVWFIFLGARCMVPGARYVVPGARCLIPWAWYMVPCPWCAITGAWFGARSVVAGAWCVIPAGAWIPVPGDRSLLLVPWGLLHRALSLVRGSWCMVWCEIHGTWCLVHGAWCLVPGARSVIRGTRCMVRDPWCLDPGAWSGARSGVVGALCLVPGGLAGCLPLHHGGSGWCAMGASPNAFSSHPMDVWSVFPWRGGDSRESSVEPNPGRTWPGACWSLGKIRAPRCDMVWHVGCKAEASRERSLVPIGNLGASHDAIISRHERTRVRSSPSAIGAGWHGFFRGGILGDACTRHRCVSRFGTLAKCIKGYHSLRIVPFGNKTWTLRCNPWGVHRETKRDVVALSLGSTCSSWKDAVLGDALTSNRLSRRFTKGRKPR